ncbi:uncharacterized protein LOC120162669 [Hibiscus syriacus]|uniref:uncharacterized protein LOC120162669 n=1 Tax=Hibiscus syriacus TaxID=106335 RepID=UPI001920FA43|nr:uncharacterized protein LOC120162669 [Hibiscus syriacus]
MGDRHASRYWCYMCSQVGNPMTHPEIKCLFCDSGFVEEMDSLRNHSNANAIDSGSVHNLSLWTLILLGLMGGLSPSHSRTAGQDQINGTNSQDSMEDSELGRRRSSTSAIRMLQDMRTLGASESDNSENGRDTSGIMVLFDPINEEALIVQGSFDINHRRNPSRRSASSFGGEYTMGPGWDFLLQYMFENR